VALDGVRWAAGDAAGDADALAAAMNVPAVLRAQAGGLDDMEAVKTWLYAGRTN
jgi:hypothetical protein